MLVRLVLKTVIALALTLTTAGALVWFGLQPPTLPVPPRTTFTIKDVTLINPGEGRANHVDIAVAEGLIRKIAPTASANAPTDIRCGGCFALPGLMDMHAHMPPLAAVGNERLFALLFLANGVTTIREMGSADGGAYQIRDAIAAGAYPGPRVISCGRVLDGDPPTRDNNVVVRTPAEARAEVAKAVKNGARCIKLYNMLKRDVVLAIADATARAGIPIVAHVPHSVSLLDAPYIADVQHFTGVPEPADPAKVGIDDYLNEDFANLTDARIRTVVDAALRQGTIHTPALINEDVRRTLGDPYRFRPNAQLRVLPTYWTKVWRNIWNAPNLGADAAIYEGFRARERALLRAMFEANVPIYAGTDTLMPFVAPGAALHDELRNFVDVGRTPEQALVTATTAPGRFWKDRTYGRIAVGLPADIVLFGRDPTQTLDALNSIEVVIADGRVYHRAQLDEWVATYRAHFRGPLYTNVMNVAVDFLSGRYEKGTPEGDN